MDTINQSSEWRSQYGLKLSGETIIFSTLFDSELVQCEAINSLFYWIYIEGRTALEIKGGNQFTTQSVDQVGECVTEYFCKKSLFTRIGPIINSVGVEQ